MESYRLCFNKAVKKYASDDVMKVIENCRRSIISRDKDYFITLDRIGHQIGVVFIMNPVWHEHKEVILSYMPMLKLYKPNVPNSKAIIREFPPIKSKNEAYEFLAKEYVYAMEKVDDLEVLVSTQ